MRRLRAFVACGTAIVGGFFFIVRPWYLRWGATEHEVHKVLPGDEIVPNAHSQETRAITIYAPAARVWPWLAQIGQDRGGFYSYDLLENLVGCEMPVADSLRPGHQSWRAGDKLWMYPKEKAGGIGFATLRTYLPGRALGFGTHSLGTSPSAPEDGSWSFVLEPIDDSATRLLVRGRGAAGRSLLGVAFDRSIFEPAHFVMERRMMIGLKQLAEQSDRHRALNHVHVVLWTITFGLLIAAGVLVFRRDHWGRRLLGFVTAAVAFQILTLAQPPVPTGIALVVLTAAIVWEPTRRPPGPPASGRYG